MVMEIALVAIGGLILCTLIVAVAYKIRKRYRASKRIKENDYKIDFL